MAKSSEPTAGSVTGSETPPTGQAVGDPAAEDREHRECAAILYRLMDLTEAAVFFVSTELRVRFLNRRAIELFGIEFDPQNERPAASLLEELTLLMARPQAFAARTLQLYDDLTIEVDEDVELSVPQRRLLRRKSGPVRDGEGVLLGRIEVYIDHTEAEDRRNLLEAQNRELDAFASRLAHDLKTPIVSLKGFADLLDRQCGAALDQRATLCLDKIRSSAAILGEMVDGIRSLVDASRQRDDSEAVDPLPVLRMVTEALAPEAAEGGVEISLPPAVPPVKGDRAKLFQMFQNLLANAILYRDDDKPVRWVLVEAAERNSEIELRVTDNGVGLDPDEAAEVFQPFRRGRRAAGKPGTGLGLAITQRVAQTCGGRIELRSNPGEGSSFSLFLPRAR